jgi:hypothetical protein
MTPSLPADQQVEPTGRDWSAERVTLPRASVAVTHQVTGSIVAGAILPVWVPPPLALISTWCALLDAPRQRRTTVTAASSATAAEATAVVQAEARDG